MELKEFIASTLGEIQEGVQMAINETIKSGVNGAINPSWGGTNNINASLIQNVNFDIAVTVADEEKAGVKGGKLWVYRSAVRTPPRQKQAE